MDSDFNLRKKDLYYFYMEESIVSLFMMQAEKISKEVFDKISENSFDRIEVKQLENQGASTGMGDAFYSIIARDQLEEEIDNAGEKAFISNVFTDDEKICFFIFYYEQKDEKIFQKYQILWEKLVERLSEFLITEWKKENCYFYNESISSIIIKNSTQDLVTEISKKCCGYEDVALFENVNLSMLNILSELSFMTYEKSSTAGLIYFIRDRMDVDFQFEFDDYEVYGGFNMKNLKLLRKLLELTDSRKGIGIITDTNRIYGIGSIKQDRTFYSVSFEEDHKWILYKMDEELFTVRDSELHFQSSTFRKPDFISYAEKIFPEKKDSEELSNLHGIIKTLMKQQKGSILVVMKGAKDHISKYRDLSILINPVKLDEKNVEKLSSIDGAIIMDENCMCYGFGAVLDGLDTGTGNRARGSRYNSSERFYNLYKKEDGTGLMVFILSDDGNYNFFPNKE